MSLEKKIAIVVSGVGYEKGSDIVELSSLLILLSQRKIVPEFFGPHSILELFQFAFQIPCADLAQLKVDAYDALIVVGGYGALNVLSDFASKGVQFQLDPTLQICLSNFHQQSKPIGCLGLGVLLVGRMFAKQRATLTTGKDQLGYAVALEKMGINVEDCDADDYLTDRENKIISTATFLAPPANPSLVFLGINGMLKELLEMA